MDRLGDFLRDQFPMPTGDTVRKTDAAMARTAKGLCGFCGSDRINEDGECLACREEA